MKTNLVEVCRGCYATTGQYNFPNVKGLREHNRLDWKRDDWVADMVAAISSRPYFRWFDSGDVYDVRLASKIYQVIRATPETKHWLPTRSYKFPKIRKELTKIKRLPNAAVRYSADELNSYRKSIHGCVVYHGEQPKGTFGCRAYERGGKCGDCRACWDKTIKTVAIPTHGVKMTKVANEQRG